MYNIIIIVIIIIFFLLFINIESVRNTFYFENDANYQYNLDTTESTKCNSYNCSNDINDGHTLLIGNDKNSNPIFKYKDNFYKLNSDNTLIQSNIESIDIKYYDNVSKILTDTSTMKLKVNYNYKDYVYVGTLNNNYYNQEYILYEKPYEVQDKELEDKLYYYVLIKIIEGVYTVMYDLPPRNKILPKESIWASYGSFQIGPLMFNI